MPYCPNCGQQVGEGMRFCPSCGSQLAALTAVAETQSAAVTPYVEPTAPVTYSQPAAQTVTYAAAANDYRLVLISCGSCTKTAARSLFREVFGYTLAEATKLTNLAPIEIACALTFEQALNLGHVQHSLFRPRYRYALPKQSYRRPAPATKPAPPRAEKPRAAKPAQPPRPAAEEKPAGRAATATAGDKVL